MKRKVAKLTLAPEWAMLPDNGGYTVQPFRAPISTIDLINRRVKYGGKNQNLVSFIRGNAESGAPPKLSRLIINYQIPQL